MIRVKVQRRKRVFQGDIFRDVEYIECVSEKEGTIEVSRVVYPLVIVLTQDCDLLQDYNVRWSRKKTNTHDKAIVSVLVAPLYNAEHVYLGEHLSELGLTMQVISKGKTDGNHLRNNEKPRYHYLEFPTRIPIVPSVIDFKHYFSVHVSYLRAIGAERRVCQVGELYREDICQRFASFLARIGLP